jgi:hypothetical protein
MKIEGGCHCGGIRFEAEVDPAAVVICHCTDCQTFSGSAFRTVVLTKPGTFALLAGAPTVYVKTAESGSRRQQTFCPTCGTPLYSAPVSGDTTVVVLRVGTLHQRDRLAPRDQYWFRSSQAWLPSLSTIKKQDRQPFLDEAGAPHDS